MSSQDLKKRLKEAIAEIERLKKENQELKSQIKSDLHKQSESYLSGIDSNFVDGSASNDAKIKIFRNYFKGRDDVYAVRWSNSKGRSGYAPACYYEWDPAICKKPHAKCQDCKYIPVDDNIIRKHLSGQQVIGVYPILKDDTCWFLAVDFDKTSWQKDVKVFIATCQELGVPYVLERSRSGNGCHVWFFFSERTSASIARRLVSGILTASLTKRHKIGFDSYDRLFPNQDKLPHGGFGNLIALPLQANARRSGNTTL